MRICLIALLLKSILLEAQEVFKLNTEKLVVIARNKGVDHVPYIDTYPIHEIDSQTTIELVQLIHEYKPYSNSARFFNRLAQNLKSELIQRKTFEFTMNEIERINRSMPNEYGSLYLFDAHLMVTIVKQKPDSIEDLLFVAYSNTRLRADTFKSNFPSNFVRFFHSFNMNLHPIEEAYIYCHHNCFKFMMLLGELNSDLFDNDKLEYHRSQLKKYQQHPDFYRCQVKVWSGEKKLIVLTAEYQSIDELDFEVESELNNEIHLIRDKNFYNTLLFGDKKAFLIINNQLGNYGEIYKLSLLNRKGLEIIKLGSFIQ